MVFWGRGMYPRTHGYGTFLPSVRYAPGSEQRRPRSGVASGADLPDRTDRPGPSLHPRFAGIPLPPPDWAVGALDGGAGHNSDSRNCCSDPGTYRTEGRNVPPPMRPGWWGRTGRRGPTRSVTATVCGPSDSPPCCAHTPSCGHTARPGRNPDGLLLGSRHVPQVRGTCRHHASRPQPTGVTPHG